MSSSQQIPAQQAPAQSQAQPIVQQSPSQNQPVMSQPQSQLQTQKTQFQSSQNLQSQQSQQSQLQTQQQGQGAHLREGDGGSLSAGTTGISVTADYSITDPRYQPQEQILGMTSEAKTAFQAQYDLVRFDGCIVPERAVSFLQELVKLAGVRIAFYPVRERASTIPTIAQSNDPNMTNSGTAAGAMSPISYNAQSGGVSGYNDGQSALGANQSFTHSSLAPMFLPHTVRTTNNFLIQGTSAIFSLLCPEIPPNHWENAPIPFRPGTVGTGQLQFINCSQLPSEANRLGRIHPPKPCMHLFLFSPCSATPIAVVERYLREKNRVLRVFNGDLEFFGRIECTQSFPMGAKKVTITGPDQVTPIFFIKAVKTAGLLTALSRKTNTIFEYSIRKGKTTVGYYTTRYSASEKVFADIPPLDLFFPKEDTDWPQRIMLIVAGLYMDYLLAD